MNISGIGARPDVDALLSQMRMLKAAAQAGVSLGGGLEQPAAPSAADKPSFSVQLGKALESVNRLQQQATVLADGFAKGDNNDLVGVMVASQKASVAFQAATQVRNRLVNAYEEIMRMPI